MKVLIPMAGEGSRFAKAGYEKPKPLIDVMGMPMIARVVENLRFDADYIFLVRTSHLQRHPDLVDTIDSATGGRFTIVPVDSLTEGAACTAILAKQHIDCDEDLFIANSDQLIEWNRDNFLALKSHSDLDGIVLCFRDTDPKWSFVRTGDRGLITEVAEKRPISDIATCGIYWYRKGSDFVRLAESMVSKDIRVNGEFYIAPVYNELIGEGGKLIPYFVDRMHGIGTPEDLRKYLGAQKKFDGHYNPWRERRLNKLVGLLGGSASLKGKRTLELAAGHGGVSAALADMGAIPTAADGRTEHVDHMRENLKGVHVIHLDQRYPYHVGDFDIVIHWGVLYHLPPSRWESDLADASAHAPIMFLETEVCDSDDPDHVLRVEEAGYDQSMDGVGVRPSAAAVEMALRQLGMNFNRYDEEDIGTDLHKYDWKVEGTGRNIMGMRRFWMCRKDES